MAAPRRALIAGATGLVGARLLARLLEAPAYAEVHALVRRPLPAGAVTDGTGGGVNSRATKRRIEKSAADFSARYASAMAAGSRRGRA